MMRNLKAVSFDMGFTLSHQDPTREDLLMKFLRERGHQRSLHDMRRAFVQTDTWWHLWIQQNPTAWREEELRQMMRRKYRDAFLAALELDGDGSLNEPLSDFFQTSITRRHNAIFPDVFPTLQALRARGLKLAIVSNWDNSLIPHCDDLGLTPLFDAIVGSVAVGYDKPDPRIFEVALGRLGVAAGDAIHVGDMYPADVVGARRAGMVPILLDRYDLQPDVDCLRVATLDQILPLLSV
jgi:HAD superfamily hydrolase (TIGR01509 family)